MQSKVLPKDPKIEKEKMKSKYQITQNQLETLKGIPIVDIIPDVRTQNALFRHGIENALDLLRTDVKDLGKGVGEKTIKVIRQAGIRVLEKVGAKPYEDLDNQQGANDV